MFQKMDAMDLDQVAGGNGGRGQDAWRTARVTVAALSLCNYPSEGRGDEKGTIPGGKVFEVNAGRASGTYVWARYNGTEGWVEQNGFVFC